MLSFYLRAIVYYFIVFYRFFYDFYFYIILYEKNTKNKKHIEIFRKIKKLIKNRKRI